MGKYFIPILPGPSPATNQNTVPRPPVPVKLTKTLHHTGPDLIQMDIPHQLKEIFILLVINDNYFSRQEKYLGDSNPW
jgi:hypothetical protein